jgi:flagellin-like hook-associated protein FlgL
MATAISRLQAVNNQLQASYNVLSMVKSLNLANYL